MIARYIASDTCLYPGIIGGTIGDGRCGRVVRIRLIIRTVVVVEGRDLEHGVGTKAMPPCESDDAVRLMLRVAQTAGVVKLVFVVALVWVIGYLKEIATQLGQKPELVNGILVKYERAKAAIAVLGVVNGLLDGWGQPVVASISVQTGIVGSALRMIPEGDLLVSFEGASDRCHNLAFAVSFEATLRVHIEDAISTVAEVRVVASSIYLKVLNVTGIDLRTKVGSDVGIRDLDAVQKPADLMTAAHVQHVMCDVGAGDVIGDHRQRIAAIGTGRVLDCRLPKQYRGCHRTDVRGIRRCRHRDALLHSGHRQGDVQDRRCARRDGDRL